MPATISDLAREAAAAFTHGTRDCQAAPGSPVRVLRPETPEWVRDMVHDAHIGMCADDWAYRMIESACDWLIDNDPDPDAFANSEVSEYTYDLIRWLGSHRNRLAYTDEAAGAGRMPITERIAEGWCAEAREIFSTVLQCLEREADDR